ncbi:unnamed protein product, partial [Discosporangium mesarthrocarpum]
MQVLNLPYEARNRYSISLLPEGKQVGYRDIRSRAQMWKPTGEEIKALHPMLIAQEESSFWNRCFFACIGC